MPVDDGPRSHRLRKLVQDFMIHKDTHLQSQFSRCNKKGKCIYGFPQATQQETIVDEYGRVKYRRRSADDAWVTSYMPALLELMECHIHVDVCFTANVILYLYKYLYKTPVPSKFTISEGNVALPQLLESDEWQNGRHLCSNEGCWRILRFHITNLRPTVVAITPHLPGQQLGQMFQMKRAASPVTKLLIYLNRPSGEDFDQLLLLEFYKHYRVTSIPQSQWPPTEIKPGEYPIQVCERGLTLYYMVISRQGKTVISRLRSMPPKSGELFYLRAVLQHKAGQSWNDLYTIDGVMYPSFQAVAIALGLFPQDGEAYYAMQEAIQVLYSPSQLRFLFASILTEFPTDAPQLYADFLEDMASDLKLVFPYNNQWENELRQSLQRYLQSRGSSLKDYDLPMPTVVSTEVALEHAAFDSRFVEMTLKVEEAMATFNPEQQHVYKNLQQGISNPGGPLLHFLDGKAGRGKTFLMNCLTMSMRAKGMIVLVAGSTALSVIHYERGRTAHSTFGIPVVEVCFHTYLKLF